MTTDLHKMVFLSVLTLSSVGPSCGDTPGVMEGTGGRGGSGAEGGTGGGAGNVDRFVADAGLDQNVEEGVVVALVGTATDGQRFSWEQIAGPPVELVDAGEPTARFNAPWVTESSTQLVFELTATNTDDEAAKDTVAITVTSVPFVLFLADKEQAGRPELFRAALEGVAEPVRLSPTPVVGGEVELFGASPDGQHVAFMGDLERDEVVELFFAPAAGGEVVKLNPPLSPGENVVNFRWSPNSSTIAFSVKRLDGLLDLYANRLDGFSSVPLDLSLPAGGSRIQYEWHLDGDSLAFLDDRGLDGSRELYLVALHGLVVNRVNAPLPQAEFPRVGVVDFRWSPDGGRIAYAADIEVRFRPELYIVSPDGSGNVKASGALIGVRGVTRYEWSPDGEHVAYQADQDAIDRRELYVTRRDGSGGTRLNETFTGAARVLSFAWSPNGNEVAYLADPTAPEKLELFTTQLENAGTSTRVNGPLATGGRVSDGYVWSPLGNLIAYRADQQTDQVLQLYVSDAQGSRNMRINGDLVDGGGVSSGFAWSPTAERIAYLAVQQTVGVRELFVSTDEGSGNARVNDTLAEGGNVDFPGFRWTRDGASIVYLADQTTDEAFELFVSQLDGSNATKLSGTLAPGGSVERFTLE